MNNESIRHYIKQHYPFITVQVNRGHIYISSDPADPKIVCERRDDYYEIVDYKKPARVWVNARWQVAKDQLSDYLFEYSASFVRGIPSDFLGTNVHIPAGWKQGNYVFVEGTLKPSTQVCVFKRCGYNLVEGNKIELLFLQSTTRLISSQEVFNLGMLVGAQVTEAALTKARQMGFNCETLEDIIKEFNK